MRSIIFLGICVLQKSSSFLIDSCDDFNEAVNMAQTGYVNATMHPFADIVCKNFTTFVLDKYDMDIFSSENMDNYYGNVNVVNARIEVSNGTNLQWENNVEFENEEEYGDLPDVNGGALRIGLGSRIRFLNDFETTNIGVRSQTVEDSDFPDHQNYGGCVWNNGYFRVDGDVKMVNCENSGGGEGSPGPGGAIFNDVNGSILFNGTVEISQVSIIDDEGNNGGAFYNLGKINIKGDSTFSQLYAESAGAIYNGVNATFNFKRGASALFYDCKAFDGYSGAILNNGYFKFSGPALFLEGGSDYKASQISIGSTGTMILKKDSYFFNNYCSEPNCASIWVESGGSFTYSKPTSFVKSFTNYGEMLCEGVYFVDGEECQV